MSTYLELCSLAREKCGIAGTGPADVTTQTGELARLVGYVRDAYVDIQNLHPDWLWMRSSTSFTTTASTGTYTTGSGAGTVNVAAASLGSWYRDTFRCYLTATGTNDEQFLEYIPYDAWRNTFNFGAMRSATGRPTVFSISPARGICLGQIPAAGYTVTGDYQAAPTVLAADGDTPGLPAQYHMLIVWKAAMYYGVHEAAPEVYDEGLINYKRILSQLEIDQRPDVHFAGALA